jgi:hypothetical protein
MAVMTVPLLVGDAAGSGRAAVTLRYARSCLDFKQGRGGGVVLARSRRGPAVGGRADDLASVQVLAGLAGVAVRALAVAQQGERHTNVPQFLNHEAPEVA